MFEKKKLGGQGNTREREMEGELEKPRWEGEIRWWHSWKRQNKGEKWRKRRQLALALGGVICWQRASQCLETADKDKKLPHLQPAPPRTPSLRRRGAHRAARVTSLRQRALWWPCGEKPTTPRPWCKMVSGKHDSIADFLFMYNFKEGWGVLENWSRLCV